MCEIINDCACFLVPKETWVAYFETAQSKKEAATLQQSLSCRRPNFLMQYTKEVIGTSSCNLGCYHYFRAWPWPGTNILWGCEGWKTGMLANCRLRIPSMRRFTTIRVVRWLCKIKVSKRRQQRYIADSSNLNSSTFGKGMLESGRDLLLCDVKSRQP